MNTNAMKSTFTNKLHRLKSKQMFSPSPPTLWSYLCCLAPQSRLQTEIIIIWSSSSSLCGQGRGSASTRRTRIYDHAMFMNAHKDIQLTRLESLFLGDRHGKFRTHSRHHSFLFSPTNELSKGETDRQTPGDVIWEFIVHLLLKYATTN